MPANRPEFRDLEIKMSGERKTRSARTAPIETEEVMPETGAVSTSDSPVENFDSNGTAIDVFPDFAASPEEVTRRTQMLKTYVREHMNQGEDYGIIPGANKPTLFKPGAEKLNAVYGLSPMVEVTNRIEDWDSGFVAYEVKVTLINKRSNGIEAEGIGSCNSRERRYKNQDAAGIANTVLKMAKKRALIDATLSATRASGMFTQDIEDMDLEPERPHRPGNTHPPRQTPTSGGGGNASGDTLTEAQHRAILAIAGRVFGRHSREEDLLRMANKPLEDLSRGEASAVIDRLRAMLADGGSQPQEMASARSSKNGSYRR